LCVLTGCSSLDPSTDSSKSTGRQAPLFETPPDVASCTPGTLTQAYQQSIIDRLNQIRLLHQLPLVELAPDAAAPAQQAALAIVANAQITHALPPSAFCYTDDAAQSSSESLLLITAGNQVGDVHDPDRFLGDWLRDTGEPNLGHRRWMLDPFLAEVAFGFVQGKPQVSFPYEPVVGAVLDVVDQKEVDLGWSVTDFVAYPFGLYPAQLVDKSAVLSFSVIADKSTRLGSVDRVSFQNATVNVTDAEGSPLVVAGVQAHYELMGVPNALTWRVDGLTDGTRYSVSVEGVTIDDAPRDYEYEFLLMP
jgi:uncharacterized protein YkwD